MIGMVSAIGVGGTAITRRSESSSNIDQGDNSQLAGVMGMRIVKGRWFAEGAGEVAVNESLVCRDFRGEDAIGKRMRTVSAPSSGSSAI